MADTLGGLIDKLITVDMKMWNNQEFLYEVRRIPFEEFKERFVKTDEQKLELFDSLKRCCDLNYQRNVLIDEIDEMIASVLEAISSGEKIDYEKFIQRKHKTY